MSDPLSIAGSIAGIVQLSAAVFQQVSKFVKDAKGAEKTVKDLADQTRNLSGTLLAVEKRLEKPLSAFNEGSRRQAVYRSLKWPFSGEDTKGLLTQIEGHGNTISLALSTDTLEGMLKYLEKQDDIIESLISLNQKVKRLTAIQTRIECDEKRPKIIDYFLKVNPQVNLQTSSRMRLPLTGLWLTESNPIFLKWADLPRSGPWLSGISGAVKTILSSMVIEKVLQKSSQSVAVAFFYCDYKNSDSQELLNILSTIAVQLGQQTQQAFRIIEEYHGGLRSANGLDAQPEPKELLDLITNIISVYEKVFVVVDGLDEYGGNVAEVAKAIKLLLDASSSASNAVFSRDKQEIRDELADEFGHIEIAAHTEDLDIYVRAEMAHRKQLRNLSIQNPQFAEEIRHQLVNGAQGIIAQSGTDSIKLVRRVLHWTIAGSRMTLAEMRETVSFASCPTNEFGSDDLIDEGEIFRRCSSLVRKSEITRGFSVPSIELAHFTVKEYFTSIDDTSDVKFFKYKQHEADEELSTACLRLFVSRAENTKLDTMADLTLNMNRILDLESMPPPSATVVSVAVQHDDLGLLKAVINQGISVNVELPRCLSCPQTPLVLSIILGRRQSVLWLLSQGASLENCACRKLPLGLQSLVSVIMFYKLDIDILELALEESLRQKVRCTEEELNPFHVAALRSNSDAMRCLLKSFEESSRLFCSTRQPRELGLTSAAPMLRVFPTLINDLSTVTSDDNEHWPREKSFRGTPLHYAVVAGFETSVLLLLSHDADSNTIDQYQRSTLIIAVQNNLTNIAQLLVNTGVDLASSDDENQTALMCAATGGNMEMIKVLDKSNVVLSMPDLHGHTAIQYALSDKDTAVSTFIYFIERGLEPVFGNSNAIECAASYVFRQSIQNKPLVTFVLNSGFLTRITEFDIGNPLSCAVAESDDSLLRRLWRILQNCPESQRLLNG
ncbi:hypothetical protein CSAL01_02471 [Colletotrichum salicis]|uniref:Nephrocystin 3-like N-terminal domain-containing protein n=1 Tax=Colletotrichum salicis TaxID=1209931 RepID=A0A135RY83_9PEZI|nr:hypothetical protein CSAL01_02471 [Colletotrichum salicis]